MKRTITFYCRYERIVLSLFFMVAVAIASAQNTGQTVSLSEVEVKAARTVSKSDGMLLYPTDGQKRSASSGYAILQQLHLPGIRIDEVAYSVSALDNRGSVQLRINGIIVGKAEMLSLTPSDIVRIDFVDQPGVRYGEGIAYVIDIHTRRPDSGYTVGTSLAQSLTVKNGSYDVYGKWNTGKSELSLNYGFSYKDFRGDRVEERADYHLTDGSVCTIRRSDVDTRSRDLRNALKLTYNLADSSRYVFQASLSGDFSHVPGDFSRKHIQEGGEKTYTALRTEESLIGSPVLDLYYFHQFTSRQSVTLNAVGTYIHTDSSDSYDEGEPYRYDVYGKTYSLMSEGIYENCLKPFILSAGINYRQKYTDNKYAGSVSSVNRMRNSRTYLFSEIKGFWNRLRYSAGVGMVYKYYRQQEHSYCYWQFCPKASLSYNFTNRWQLSYNFQSTEHASRIAMIGDAMIRTNSMEWIAGSPDLRPNRENYNILKLSYTDTRLQAYLQGLYKSCHRTNMAVYERTEDNRFIYTQRNQKEIDALHLMGYADYWLVSDKLSVNGSGGLFRCFNFGYDYTHCYTSYFITGALNAYLGNLSLSAYADNGWHFLEGETKGSSGASIAFKVSYGYKDWQFALHWQQPLMHNYKMNQSEILNRYLQKSIAGYSTDACNLVSLTVTWQLNRGRKFRTTEKTIHLKDTETGIIR